MLGYYDNVLWYLQNVTLFERSDLNKLSKHKFKPLVEGCACI
jgi:hypothetical protein